MATLDEIHREWSEDCLIDEAALDRVSSDIPRLHAKYIRFLSNERMTLRKLESDLAELKRAKADRLTGSMTREDLEARGWKPEQRKILSGQVDSHVQADREVVEMKLRVALQVEKTEVLESVVKMVMNRNFVVKNLIDWKKFLAGAL